jgi:hypothetical protein
MLRPMPYPEIYMPDDPDYRPTAASRTLFLDGLDAGAAQNILDRLEASDAPLRVAQLRVLGGAVARVPDAATAYAHRARPIMGNVAAFYTGPEDRAAKLVWVNDCVRALQPGKPAAYVNFLGDEGEAAVRAAYPGTTWERLRQIKRRYDPDNLFRLNQNIPPAASV